MRVTAYIGLGSNLGDRARTIREGLAQLASGSDIEVTRVSEMEETAPLGAMDQPNYLNGVAEIKTSLAPTELLHRLKATEAAMGRPAGTTWQPRTIDLDLLLFGDQVIHSNGLNVPHLQMHLRSFVLDGLCQLNPDLVHPVLKEPVSELSRRLGGGNFILDPEVPQIIGIAGVIGVGKTTLANKLAEVLPGEVLYEPYNTNPFLPQVYAGKKELALDCQLYFLVHRVEQLDRDRLPRRTIFILDYVFEKEQIYAHRLLNATQLDLYQKVYAPLAGRVATPVLAIHLQDSPEACLQRIRCRNRPYEQGITRECLAGQDEDYRRLFAGWKTCPVIRAPASRLTGYSESVVEHLVLQVRAYLAPSVQPSEVA